MINRLAGGQRRPDAFMAEKFDSVAFIMDYEAGTLDADAIIAGFQHLIDSGLVWQLQGAYQRQANTLIDAGYCHRVGGGADNG